jgi:hypothetical protein
MSGQSICRRCMVEHRLAGEPKSLAEAGWVKAAERLTTIVRNKQRNREHLSVSVSFPVLQSRHRPEREKG